MKERTCCFTGHRTIPKDQLDIVASRTEDKIRELILEKGVRYFGVGGAIGYDTLAAQILFRLKETESPQIKVILVYPFEDFTSRWTDAQKVTYAQMLCRYDKRVCVALKGNREAYLVRDRHLVNGSSYCISFCARSVGGTAYTVRYALHKGITVYNVADYDVSLV